MSRPSLPAPASDSPTPAAPPPTLVHRLEWLALRGLKGWMGRGGMDDATHRARFLGRLGRRVLHSEWQWANTNLELVYGPHLSPVQRRRLAELAFENIFTSYMEALRCGELAVSVEPGLATHLSELHARNQGLIIASIHLGSWEGGLLQLPRLGYPAAVVYRHANNPLNDREINATRAAYGVTLIPRTDPRATFKALREKKMLVLMTDINTRQGGVAAPFLGATALCPPGAARLAIQFGCPVLPIVTVRTAPGEALSLGGTPLEPPAKGGGEGAVAHFTARINAAFDPWVHQYAEQYNWLHRRWRSRPDGTLWRPPLTPDILASARVAPFATLSPRVERLLA